MKRIIISLLAFTLSSFTFTYAQGIQVGDRFYDGSVVYTVREVRMGTVVYMTYALGDEELTLEQCLRQAIPAGASQRRPDPSR